jgi:3-hydroxyethyl bacteriochlorophyllide a dehydrogenase
LETHAIVLEAPGRIDVRTLGLRAPGPEDLVIEIDWSGVSTGTERLLFQGAMPPFPGMGYPLVPGYESVGRVVDAGERARGRLGETVFVPGSTGFEGARPLFGGAARRVVTAAARVSPIAAGAAEDGVLLALAATARHALSGGRTPDLVVGHGVLGRLIARLATLRGGSPTVWEVHPARRDGAHGYRVCAPEEDARRDYAAICDASGDARVLDALIGRLAKGGEICLAGFYDRLSFAFAPAFMKEARLRVAAEFTPEDVAAVNALVASGALSLKGLVSHRRPAADAADAYAQAFSDPACLKMVIDWRNVQ